MQTWPLFIHFLLALVLGIALRSICAFYAYGAQSMDDYRHGLLPAYLFSEGATDDMLPGFRSYLLVWLIAFLVKMLNAMGIDGAMTQTQWIYLALGGMSMSVLVGGYLYVRHFNDNLFAGLTLYLLSLHFMMPFVSTRAFGESISMGILFLGLAVAEDQRLRRANGKQLALGFLLLGLASLFRFQVGVIYLTYWILRSFGEGKKTFLIGLGCGVVAAAAQAGIDMGSGRYPLETLVAYVDVNKGGAVQHGVTPWYSTWLTILAAGFFPLSIVFFRHLSALYREHFYLVWSFIVFVFLHSLIPHKEERFMFPALPMLILFTCYLWSRGWNDYLVRWFYTPVAIVFGTTLLFVVTFSNSQAGEVEPVAHVEGLYKKVLYVDFDSLAGRSYSRDYIFREPNQLIHIESLSQVPSGEGFQATVVMTSVPERAGLLASLEGCTVYKSHSVTDALVFYFNPEFNQRRRPTWYAVCPTQVETKK